MKQTTDANSSHNTDSCSPLYTGPVLKTEGGFEGNILVGWGRCQGKGWNGRCDASWGMARAGIESDIAEVSRKSGVVGGRGRFARGVGGVERMGRFLWGASWRLIRFLMD